MLNGGIQNYIENIYSIFVLFYRKETGSLFRRKCNWERLSKSLKR